MILGTGLARDSRRSRTRSLPPCSLPRTFSRTDTTTAIQTSLRSFFAKEISTTARYRSIPPATRYRQPTVLPATNPPLAYLPLSVSISVGVIPRNALFAALALIFRRPGE
jgi:hypothetical protein